MLPTPTDPPPQRDFWFIRAEGTDATSCDFVAPLAGSRGSPRSSLLVSPSCAVPSGPVPRTPYAPSGPPRPAQPSAGSLSEGRRLPPGSLQTCGTPPGASCSETECGGPNCRTDDGEKKCGAPGCGGLVTVAHSAWQKAMDFDRDVLSALAEVEQLSNMVTGPPAITHRRGSGGERRTGGVTLKAEKSEFL